jgi:large subunit ribosomal protein L15
MALGSHIIKPAVGSTHTTKRLGRGHGSGKGTMSGRGGKGQTARAGNKRRPAMRDIIKKLPKLRGHGKNRAKSVFYRGPEVVVNVGALSVFKAGDVVTPTALRAHGLITVRFEKAPVVKILGGGDLSVKLSVEGCVVSESAKAKIEKAGGSVKELAVSEAVASMQAKNKARLEARALKKGGKTK